MVSLSIVYENDMVKAPYSLCSMARYFCILSSFFVIATSSESLHLHGRNENSRVKSFRSYFKRDWYPLFEPSTVLYLLFEARVGWSDARRDFRAWYHCGRTNDQNFIAGSFTVIFWIHITNRDNSLQKVPGPTRALWPWLPISYLLPTWVEHEQWASAILLSCGTVSYRI